MFSDFFKGNKEKQLRKILKELSEEISDFSQSSSLDKKDVENLPRELAILHEAQIFGTNILALPAEYFSEGDEMELEDRVHFLDNWEELSVFENEFRSEIPQPFQLFAYTDGKSAFVLLNTDTGKVHRVYVSDVVDSDWLQYKLTTPLSTYKQFLQKLRPQTVACFINPEDSSDYDIIEIRGNRACYSLGYEKPAGEEGFLEAENKETLWKHYFSFAQKSLDKGFSLRYGPQKLLDKFDL